MLCPPLLTPLRNPSGTFRDKRVRTQRSRLIKPKFPIFSVDFSKTFYKRCSDNCEHDEQKNEPNMVMGRFQVTNLHARESIFFVCVDAWLQQRTIEPACYQHCTKRTLRHRRVTTGRRRLFTASVVLFCVYGL